MTENATKQVNAQSSELCNASLAKCIRANAPLHWYLSNRFENRFDNRLDVCLHDTAGCETGCTSGLTTGCIV